ncbi:hypothetical protein AB1Y20_003796 [Prymnesium parvum]|uniref:Uncharacterized protein n=1 Tax=Prymnesium parvum TaxID=97485 RepID=A0AB34J5Y2_PRYPA
MIKPDKTTAAAQKYKVKIQDPAEIDKYYRMHERLPNRGWCSAKLILKKAMGKMGKMVAMAAAPLILRARIPLGKAANSSLPSMSFKVGTRTSCGEL